MALDMAASVLAGRLAQAGAPVRRWGWPGALGLGCLAAALAAAAAWLPALRVQSESIASAAQDAELRAARAGARPLAVEARLPPAQQFRERFAPAQVRQERLAVLLAVAAEHGLQATRSDLRLGTERGIGLLRYSVTMPLTGPYARLRAFIEDALARDPALGLDRLRLRRSARSANEVDAELAWSFYMQPEAATPPATADPRSAAR